MKTERHISWLVILVATCLILILGPATCANVSTIHAIVVGISEYESIDAACRFADHDARGVASALHDCMGVTLVTTLIDRKATSAAIETAMNSLLNSTNEHDAVIFYFAGHGLQVQDRDGDEGTGDDADEVLAPYDYHESEPSRCISDDELALWANSLPASIVLIIVDSCFSGGAGRSLPPGPREPMGGGLGYDLYSFPNTRSGRILLVACQEDEVAWPDAMLRHGIFTYYLLQGLERKRADADRDGSVSVGELAAYISDHLAEYPQTPIYINPSDIEFELIPSSISARSLSTYLLQAAPALGMTAGIASSLEYDGSYFEGSLRLGDSLSLRGSIVLFSEPFEYSAISVGPSYSLTYSPIRISIGAGVGLYSAPSSCWRSLLGEMHVSVKVDVLSWLSVSVFGQGCITEVDETAIFGHIGIGIGIGL